MHPKLKHLVTPLGTPRDHQKWLSINRHKVSFLAQIEQHSPQPKRENCDFNLLICTSAQRGNNSVIEKTITEISLAYYGKYIHSHASMADLNKSIQILKSIQIRFPKFELSWIESIHKNGSTEFSWIENVNLAVSQFGLGVSMPASRSAGLGFNSCQWRASKSSDWPQGPFGSGPKINGGLPLRNTIAVYEAGYKETHIIILLYGWKEPGLWKWPWLWKWPDWKCLGMRMSYVDLWPLIITKEFLLGYIDWVDNL